jgi:hypothetical protein
MPAVYFLKAVSSGWIKIGCSKRSLDRVSGSNTFCPNELKLLKVIEGVPALVRFCSRRFCVIASNISRERNNTRALCGRSQGIE